MQRAQRGAKHGRATYVRSDIVEANHLTTTHFSDTITIVHVLPFFPSTGDDGFSVQNYFAVDEKFGDWNDIGTRFGKNVCGNMRAGQDWNDIGTRLE